MRQFKNVDEARAYLELEKLRDAAVDRWNRERAIDAQLRTGIEAGMTFNEFKRETGCPGHLADQYIRAQLASGIAPHSVNRRDPIGESIERALTE